MNNLEIGTNFSLLKSPLKNDEEKTDLNNSKFEEKKSFVNNSNVERSLF